MIYIAPYSDNVFFKALQIPLHIGVILFVLLSGYFKIKPSPSGLFKLLFVFAVYSLPEVIYNISTATDIKSILKSALFLSHTHFWFIRTYLFLYLVSPVINVFIDNASHKNLYYMQVALFFICIYVGTTGGDPAMTDGKNVLNFMFIYMLGNLIRMNSVRLSQINIVLLIFAWCGLNTLLVLSYVNMSDNVIGSAIWRLSFPYCSPILIISSAIFFIIFLKFHFKSHFINWIAKSSLAIYLIHANRPLFINMNNLDSGIIGMMISKVQCMATSDTSLLLYVFLVALLILILAILIDKCLFPVWKLGNMISDRLFKRKIS